MTQTIIDAPDSAIVAQEYSPVVDRAHSLTVTNMEEHETGLDILKQIASAERRVDDLFEEPARAAHQAHKAITAAREKLRGPLQEARRIVSGKVSEYEIKALREAEEERQRLELQAKKAEEDRQLADAIAAEEAGDKVGAEAILQEEVQAPVVSVAPRMAEVKGVFSRVQYRADVVSMLDLVRYVAAHPEDLALLQVNTAAVNARARSQRDGFKLAGCKLVKETLKAVRTA
jgi:hypothetical protein